MFSYWLQHKASDEERASWCNAGLGVRQKQELLLQWLIYRARNYEVEVEVVTSAASTTLDTTGRKFNWMSKERMEALLGVAKAKHWISSGKLESRADALTGSEDEELKEYKVGRNRNLASL